MRRIKKIYLFILLLLICHQPRAQNPHPYFRNYTTNDGLPSPEVHHAIQDSVGYMWFATDNGISRFDGYEFKNFGPKEGLKHNVAFYLQKDPEGRIWIATLMGHLYYVEKDSIISFSGNEDIQKETGYSKSIIDFYIDSGGHKYLSFYEKGLLKIKQDGNLNWLHPSSPEIPKLALRVGERWMVSGTGIASKRNGVLKDYSKHISAIEILDDTLSLIPPIEVSKKISSADWIRTFANHETFRFANRCFYSLKGNRFFLEYSIGYGVELKAVYEKPSGEIMLGGQSGGGLRIYDQISSLKEGLYSQFLRGISITSIYKDDQGGYWFTTIENGIYYCPDFNLKIFDQRAGFPSDYVAAFDFADDENLYVGFRNGKLISLNIQNNKIEHLQTPTNTEIIYDLLYDKKRNELWLSGRKMTFLKGHNWFSGSYKLTKKINFDISKDFLLGTRHGGFGKIDLETKEMVYNSWDLGISSRTQKFYQSRDHTFWVANVNGFFELRKDTLLEPFPFNVEFSTRAEDIDELSDGTLVIATKGEGVLLWKGDYFQKFSQDDGMTADMIENIHVDNRGQIWAGTLEGVNKIWQRNKQWTIENYTVHNGLPSNEITQIKSIDSTVWIGTTRGLVEWIDNPESEGLSKPFVEYIKVNNQRHVFPAYQNLDRMSDLVLSHDENDLEIHILSINYRMDGMVPYRFRINGQHWNETRDRSIYLSNLSHGDYAFEVQAQNENKTWSPSKLLYFQINPPFWQTLWFIILMLTVLLATAWFLIKSKFQKIKQAARIEKEMNELQHAALRAQMNPHFIFNCLNSIQSFISQNDRKNATKYLVRFAELIRGALNASIEKSIPLENELKLLENYLELEKLRFKNKFEYKIEIDPELDLYETSIPPLISQPLLENAIIHGMKEKTDDGIISIIFKKLDNQLEIEIRDNGDGVFQYKNQNMNKSRLHKSFGIQISKKRLELDNMANHLEIAEIKDATDKVVGTSIKLYIDQE